MRRLWMLLLAATTLVACRTPDPERPGTLHRDQMLVHDDVERTYHWYAPATDDTPRPLVLSLHGGGGTIDNHLGVDGAQWPWQVWLDVADEDGVHVVVPQGVNQQWNDCRAECERCGNEDDVGFLVALVDAIAAQANIDRNRVYVQGESNGGFMTQRLLQEVPEVFAAGGVTIALMPADNACDVQNVPRSVMYQLGTDDALVPYDGGSENAQIVVQSKEESVAYWTNLNQCTTPPSTSIYDDLDVDDGSTVTREDHRCEATGTEVSVLTMDGAGHVPPSIDAPVGGVWELLAGRQNHDVEAVRELWAFFADKALTP